MNQSEWERLALDIDRVESDLVQLQSRLWFVRQRIQKQTGKKIGFQYDQPNERGCAEIKP